MQAETGESRYTEYCSRCHGETLRGTDFAPALIGDRFLSRWGGQPLGAFFSWIKATMPPGNSGALHSQAYTEIIAFILKSNGMKPGPAALPDDITSLDTMTLPGERSWFVDISRPGWKLSEGITLPPWPPRANPLDNLRPVTDDLLKHPSDGSWLSWRRTQDAIGFSPLTQITKRNVKSLRVAWSLALPAGPNQSTPLVHDGVVFVHSFNDHIQALDAATGDELWHYVRKLPTGAASTVHRNIALYDNKVYFTASDASVVALDFKTGKVIWEQAIADFRLSLTHGGPLVARGVVMQGIIGNRQPGGGSIVGLDAETGNILWRFHTIARPGDPNDSSWNGIDPEKRSGGSVWTAGSYDADLNLAFFGPAPTYDTAPLRDLVKGRGLSNDALYTNTTVALDPMTGRLIWYYQHLPNDQWDFDWAFERQIVHLPIDGYIRKVVITAGKVAIYDALDPATGQYAFSIDLGLQNVVTAIDPKTGIKTIDPNLIPGYGRRIMVCPHMAGVKTWYPASYNPATRVLYVPLVESCMDMIPQDKGEPSYLTTGDEITLRPRPDSDGKYGRVQAIDLTTRKTLWVARQRAPQMTGVLATAGGLVFAGALDRVFTAYDADTGTELWKTKLNAVPNSTPISYLANGKQYVAMVVGSIAGNSYVFPTLVPEISVPMAANSTLWVFELPDS
ncbi:outer membrane protein assembly factor BamB family protein [Steroidobacter agaridevorans]|uniref:outer membrane protein assembly factor BamB family protein n=1 Tax=Steroidobacter agaridevorans TaxID=2695856 RepID=UPI00389AC4AB